MDRMKPRKFDKEKYDYYVQEYIRKSEERDHPISHDKLRFFDLPDGRWFVNNCPDESVKTYSDFVAWCGFLTHHATFNVLTKERATELIYKMQEKLDRPLKYDDFRGYGCYRVPIQYIRNTWGSVNKMKEELGLEIIQESMIDKQLSKEEFDNMIKSICDFIRNDNRNFVTTKEIDENNQFNNSGNLRKYAKKYYNQTLKNLFFSHGISLGNQGSGISFDFEDGEQVTSQFEYMFSKYLKDYGLQYNVDYFRDVKYSTFIPECKNNMNCDYVIRVNEKIIFIEIAGILAEYKTWFYEDKSISRSKSKEKYRLKLKEKEEMLKSHNLIYFILFPCDLTKDNFKNILENSSLELKKEIEKFNQNNIDWAKIRNTTGELDYSKPFLRDTRPKKEAV